MKRYIRHIVGPIVFVLILGATVLYVTSAKFGRLTIDVLELATGLNIEYRAITGNILQGFRIDDYRVIFSETNSVRGKRAEIHYRFNLFMLQLPNLFEVTLFEPEITIEDRKDEKQNEERYFPGFPKIRLGLRVNVKNGQISYRNGQTYEAEGISGIVFIDFIGSRVRLIARNLSLFSEDLSLNVRAMNLDADISEEEIRLNSFRLNGTGLLLKGTGFYSFERQDASFDFEKAKIDIGKFRDLEWRLRFATGIEMGGRVDFVGSITYSKGRFVPQIRGSATGFHPLERFGFETNAASDTIWVNLFDADVFGGTLFAQLKVVNLRDVEFISNFKDVDISQFVRSAEPVLVNGYLAYETNSFVGFLSSPGEYGLGLDSVLCYGSFSESRLYLDSLFVIEDRRILQAHGQILPALDLIVRFSDFDVARFERYFPVGGHLNGSIQVSGDPSDLMGLTINTDMLAKDFSVHGFTIDDLEIKSTDFQKDNKERTLSLMLQQLQYKNYRFERTHLSVTDSSFRFTATDKTDTIFVEGILRDGLRGTICSLIVNYNRVLTRNTQMIDFDIMEGIVGNVHLALANGSLEFSRTPFMLQLTGVDLYKLSRLLGLREELRGILDLNFAQDSITMSARHIDFMGLQNGFLQLSGRYASRSIIVDSLHIHDDNAQVLDAAGVVSIEHSELTAKFQDVGVWVLAFLKNFLDKPTGLMTGQVSFHGNLDQFAFSGGGRIHDGSFGVGIIASQFDSVNTDVVFEDDRIIFSSGKGIMSPANGREMSGQWISGGGVIKLEKRFGVRNLNFDFSFVNAPIQFPPFAYGIGSGNFSMNMRDRVMHYNGNISVKEAVVPLEFGMEIEEEQGVTDESWRLNVRLRGESDIWLRNRDADIEFAGELSITKERGPVHLSGVLETDRGNYYWLNHILSITQGKVTFIPGDIIDPEVDVWAQLDTREGIKIILHLYGPISEPIFEFYTDPPGEYTEQDIVTYLNLNITWQELEQIKRGDYMSKVIPHSLLSWLEGDVSRTIRQYTGLDYFRIETPFFEADEKTKLTVGKYISRNLFVTYTYDITTFSNEFNVEYFIDDKNKIHVERDDTGEYSLQYQYRLRF
ncbi:MAG: translocation/assembly module TamB domain-containing protein [candidate division WOR-3 bacterium]|nr:MAG: translocation/assembly module TamB domain-containing protein [candidate division WOR-3 bacterium]